MRKNIILNPALLVLMLIPGMWQATLKAQVVGTPYIWEPIVPLPTGMEITNLDKDVFVV